MNGCIMQMNVLQPTEIEMKYFTYSIVPLEVFIENPSSKRRTDLFDSSVFSE